MFQDYLLKLDALVLKHKDDLGRQLQFVGLRDRYQSDRVTLGIFEPETYRQDALKK